MTAETVLVVGSANVDVVVAADRRPQPGETVHGRSGSLAAGGKGANQAVAAARSGARVHLVGAVGPDVHGTLVRDALARARLGRCDLISSELPTGLASIVVTPDGENSIVVVQGANAALTPEALEPFLAELGGVAMVLLTLEVPLATVRFAIERAQRLGVRVLLNASPAMSLDRQLLLACDPLVVNESEARLLVDGVTAALSPAELCAGLLEAGARSAVVTLGGNGAGYADAHGSGTVPAFPATVVDTTGAGDGFAGALAARLVAGDSLREATVFASATAALSVAQPGTQDSYPTLASVRSFLAGTRDRNS